MSRYPISRLTEQSFSALKKALNGAECSAVNDFRIRPVLPHRAVSFPGAWVKSKTLYLLCPAWGTSWEALRRDASTRPQMPSGVPSVSASNACATASSDSSPAARKQYSTNGQSGPLPPSQRNSMLLQYARSSAWNRTSAARSLKSISSPPFGFAWLSRILQNSLSEGSLPS